MATNTSTKTTSVEPDDTQEKNPHDSLFKQALADPVVAAHFISEWVFGGGVVVEPIPNENAKAQGRRSDVAFEVSLTTGAIALVIIEHISGKPTRKALLKVRRYAEDLLNRWIKRHPGWAQLPRIFPVIFYHNKTKWNLPELFEQDAAKPSLISFSQILIDVCRTPDEKLSTHPKLRATWTVMKYSRSPPELAARLDAMLADVVNLKDEEHLEDMMSYLEKFTTDAWRALRRIIPDRAEVFMNSLVRKGIDQGRAEGKAEGKTEGRAEGKADLLIELLQERFGQLRPELQAHIRSADLALLSTWARKLLTAPDLKAVFD